MDFNQHKLSFYQDLLNSQMVINSHIGLQKHFSQHMLSAEPYRKLQQWHDSKQIIEEFIRFFTHEAHISILLLL
jgi:hypothetical protein